MADLHFREAGAPGSPAVLLVHGFPESSYMWRDVLEPLAGAGFHAVAPDLAGFGDSPPDPRGGHWERRVEALEEFRVGRGLDRVALVGHDWGTLIGLWWACEHPEAVWALVMSSGGFFPDGKWNGMAQALRTPGQGEEFVDGLTLEGLTAMMGGLGVSADAAREYFKAFADADRRRGLLEMYRSGDFAKLERFDGALAAMDVPTLALWGEDDPFAPVAGAHRFQREIPHAELVVLPGTGHFVVAEDPAGYAAALTDFLRRAA